MSFEDTSDLINTLSMKSKVEASKKLTEFYAEARFGITGKKFNNHYTDRKNDGGIDFYYKEGNTFYIFQTKFSSNPKHVNESDITHEINKITNTLSAHNPNKDAEEFVSVLKGQKEETFAVLEIIWLTTDIVKESTRITIQENLNAWEKENGWSINIDFIVIDKFNLDSVIYDVAHGYIPYTGKKSLKLEPGNWILTNWEETGVLSVICNVNINYILNWFEGQDMIDQFLQKNVRQFLGDSSKINREIGASYKKEPIWFWYKHNGIIIFADNLQVDKKTTSLK